jgi:hypothetical protein
VDLVDPLGRWAVGLGAVARTGLAARLLRLGHGRPLGEGGGLPLSGALLLFEQAAQPLDLGLQFSDAALERSAAGTGEVTHVGMVANGKADSRAEDLDRQPKALTNYPADWRWPT